MSAFQITVSPVVNAISVASSAPSVTVDGTTTTATGSAGGDLTGSYPSPTVAGIRGRTVSTTPPTDGQAYAWNASTSQWVPTTIASSISDGDKGDVTVSGSGSTWTIDNQAVSYAKIQNVTPQRLLGNPGVGAAAPSEVTLTSPLQFSGSAVQINWPGSATGQVFYRSGTTITASTKFVFDAANTTLTLNNGLGDIISMTPFGVFSPLMTLGDVSNNGTNFLIDDSAQTITATASTFNIDGNTIAAYTANAYFSTVTAGTFSGGFGEYFTNPSNGVVEIGPDGTSSSQQALTLTYNSVADWIRFGTKRKSDGNTTSGVFYFDRPLYMATGTEQQWGGWYTASAQSSAKACFTIGLLSGAQVSGSSGSMVLVTNNQKGNSNRVPTTAHADPTLYLYAYDLSSGTISNDYLRMWHQVTSANIESGRGPLNLVTPSGSNVNINGSAAATQSYARRMAAAL